MENANLVSSETQAKWIRFMTRPPRDASKLWTFDRHHAARGEFLRPKVQADSPRLGVAQFQLPRGTNAIEVSAIQPHGMRYLSRHLPRFIVAMDQDGWVANTGNGWIARWHEAA